MNTRTALLFTTQARLLWLQTPVPTSVALSLVLFSGCVPERVVRTTHSPYSTTPDVSFSVSTNMHRIFDQLSIGMSEHRVASAVEPAFLRSATDNYLGKYPFRDLLPEINPSVVTEWRTIHVQPGGWPEVLFAIFADASKTNLVDAFWFKDGSLTPVVEGLFGRNVRAVKPGDSIDKVYRLLGKRTSEYFRGGDGKWRVKFVFWAYRGRIFVIEADAAEGRVIRTGDGTI